mmetsp:Transcript_3451/g.9822  ORF Transcript_3451/g.9822 Transcript_3451/m.9822 type:complete len:340 (+) Transcript_3451:342-1361(+)
MFGDARIAGLVGGDAWLIQEAAARTQTPWQHSALRVVGTVPATVLHQGQRQVAHDVRGWGDDAAQGFRVVVVLLPVITGTGPRACRLILQPRTLQGLAIELVPCHGLDAWRHETCVPLPVLGGGELHGGFVGKDQRALHVVDARHCSGGEGTLRARFTGLGVPVEAIRVGRMPQHVRNLVDQNIHVVLDDGRGGSAVGTQIDLVETHVDGTGRWPIVLVKVACDGDGQRRARTESRAWRAADVQHQVGVIQPGGDVLRWHLRELGIAAKGSIVQLRGCDLERSGNRHNRQRPGPELLRAGQDFVLDEIDSCRIEVRTTIIQRLRFETDTDGLVFGRFLV